MPLVFNQKSTQIEHMATTFQNAPLAETLVELRWLPAEISTLKNLSEPSFTAANSDNEQFFLSFGMAVAKHNFSQSERLFPHGIPLIVHQPILRFRRADASKSGKLFQVGPGFFTANATPPYEHWDAFRVDVGIGLDALLANRSASEKGAGFTSVTLRYINVFNQQFTQNGDLSSFISDTLGFKFILPESIVKHADKKNSVNAKHELAVELNNGMTMKMVIGHARVSGQDAIALDTTIGVIHTVTKPEKNDILGQLDAAHAILQDIFLSLTKPIEGLMKPNGK